MTKMDHPSDRVLGIYCTLPWDFAVLGEFFSPSDYVYKFVLLFGATEQSGSESRGCLHSLRVGLHRKAVLLHTGQMPLER